jgi:hypothetical protein
MSGVRIVYMITELDTGGAQKMLVRLLARLDRERFSPSVVCLDRWVSGSPTCG